MKTDDQYLKDRLEMFESDGWSDLMEDLKDVEFNTKDIDTMKNEQDLYFAKGILHQLGYFLSLESATKINLEQSENL